MRQATLKTCGAIIVALSCTFLSARTFADEFKHPDTLKERSHLFGDWGGARTFLAQRGIIVDLSTTQSYQGITSGGRADVRGDWEYGGVGDAVVTIIGDRFGWKGFAAIFHAETRFGTDINSNVGLAPPNLRMLFPFADPPVVALTGWQLMQQIGGGWVVSGGQFNVGDLLDQIYHTGNGKDKFMNASFVLPLNFGVPLGVYSVPGAGLFKTRGREIEGALAVIDTKDYTNKFAFEDLFDRGATILGLWKFFYNIHGLPGYSSVIVAYDTRKFNSIDPSSWIIIPGQGVVRPEVRGSWAVSYVVDQKLWMDPDNPKRNVGMFGFIGIADDNPNVIQTACSITLEVNGLVPGRERDSFGVGYFYSGLSSNFKDLLGALPGPLSLSLRDSQGFEAYYKFGVTPWLDITADLQVVQPNLVGVDTAVIAGLRSKVTF